MVVIVKPKLFWDSSGLIATVMTRNPESAGRQLLRLGEANAVAMRVSREVLRDCETIIRRRNAALLPQLALILHQANIDTTLDPDEDTVARCLAMTGYLPDARVLAAAVECDADLFLTHDAEHFLQNPLIGPPDTKLRVVTPAEALEWCRLHLRSESNDTADTNDQA